MSRELGALPVALDVGNWSLRSQFELGLELGCHCVGVERIEWDER